MGEKKHTLAPSGFKLEFFQYHLQAVTVNNLASEANPAVAVFLFLIRVFVKFCF
jgi:hypothetical protein